MGLLVPSSSRLVLLSEVNPNGLTEVDLEDTTGNPAHIQYLIALTGLRPSAGTPNLQARAKIGGAWDTAANYEAATQWSLTTPAATAAGAHVSGQLLVSAPRENRNQAIHIDVAEVSAADASLLSTSLVKCNTVAGALTGIRLLWSTGTTFANAGRARLYALKS